MVTHLGSEETWVPGGSLKEDSSPSGVHRESNNLILFSHTLFSLTLLWFGLTLFL